MPRPGTRAQVGTAVSHPISSFARVSKSHASLDPSIKKPVLERTASRKRKATTTLEEEEREEAYPQLTRRTVSFPPSSDDELAAPVKRVRRQEPASTPITGIKQVTKGKRVAKAAPKRTVAAHKPVETTILARAKQEGKKVQTKIDGAFKKLNQAGQDGKNDGAASSSADDVEGLNKAFQKTILLHLAHNGTSSPINVNDIVPHITRSWGKRRVTLDDIRQCVALQHGLAVRLELMPASRGSGFFIQAYQRTHEPERHAVETSLHQLRLAENEESSAQRPSSNRRQTGVELLARVAKGHGDGAHEAGRERRGGGNNAAGGGASSADGRSEHEAALLNPDGSKMNLLDRLRHKQLAKANGPLPPSPAELQRRAALSRVTDVAATISMLSLANPISLPRQAFTMGVILEKLRDSMRTPMSREEGTVCVRLMASEVAPEWLRIVTIGGRDNVVVQRSGQPVDRVIQERVQKLMS